MLLLRLTPLLRLLTPLLRLLTLPLRLLKLLRPKKLSKLLSRQANKEGRHPQGWRPFFLPAVGA
jgi:hypothetical protein